MQRQPTPDIMGDVLVAHSGPEMIDLVAFATDGGTQMRAAIDTPTVNEYEDALLAADGNWPFPPVIAYYDGSAYWLADGFHRIAAARLAQTRTNAPTDVRAGTRRDAILYAAGANASHGLRRTQADKRRSVETLLRDEEWRKWSDREIARICHVSADLVGDVRKAIAPPVTIDSDSDAPTERTYTNRHGGTSTMRVDNIGSNQPQYAQVWELERHVAELTRGNRWEAPELRRAARDQRNDDNYVLLQTSIAVDYRRADLVQALHNVASQMEAKASQAAAVPAGRPLMEVIRTDEELAAEAEAADIAEREAAADEAERQAAADDGAALNDVALLTAMRRYWSDRYLRSFASDSDPEAACRRHIVQSPSGSVDERFRIETGQGHVSIWDKNRGDYWHRKADGAYTYSRWARLTIGFLPQLLPVQEEIDPWATAVAASGSRQHRAELLGKPLVDWTDDDWAAHAERSQPEPEAAAPATTQALADLPIVATTDPRLCYQVAGSNLRSAMQALAAAAAAIKGKDDYISNSIYSISRDIQFVLKVCAEHGEPEA